MEAPPFQEGRVRVHAGRLETPRGEFPLAPVTAVRVATLERQGMTGQLVLMAAIILVGVGGKGAFDGRSDGFAFLAAGMLLLVVGIGAARREKQAFALVLAGPAGEQKAVVSADRAKVERIAAAVDAARSAAR